MATKAKQNGIFSRAGGRVVRGIQRKRATGKLYKQVGKEAIARAKQADLKAKRADLSEDRASAKREAKQERERLQKEAKRDRERSQFEAANEAARKRADAAKAREQAQAEAAGQAAEREQQRTLRMRDQEEARESKQRDQEEASESKQREREQAERDAEDKRKESLQAKARTTLDARKEKAEAERSKVEERRKLERERAEAKYEKQIEAAERRAENEQAARDKKAEKIKAGRFQMSEKGKKDFAEFVGNPSVKIGELKRVLGSATVNEILSSERPLDLVMIGAHRARQINDMQKARAYQNFYGYLLSLPSLQANPLPAGIELAARSPAALLGFLELYDRMNDNKRPSTKALKKAARIPLKRQTKRNPSQAFKRMGGEFLGRDIRPARQGFAPQGAPSHLTELALKELCVGGKLYKFNPSVAAVGIDGRGKLHISNVRLERPGVLTNPAQKAIVGKCDYIVYGARKGHIANGYHFWKHPFGEDGGRKPRFTVDYFGMPRVEGGSYKIESRGIVD